jgi:hypothetical protein
MSTYDDKLMDRLEAICKLASSNFPGETDVRISVDGDATGSVRVPAYMLLAMIEHSRKSRT